MGRQVGIKEEAVYGTPVTPDEFLEVESETLQKEVNSEDIAVVRTWSTRARPQLSEKITGDLVMVGNYQDIGLLFYTLLADVDTTGAGPYEHTMPGSTGIPSAGRVGRSLTVEVERDASLVWTYAGMKVSGVTIEADTSRAARFTWNMIGKSEATGASATSATFPDFDIMPGTDIAFAIDAAAQDAVSMRVGLSWPLDEPYVLGSAAFGKEPKTSGPLTVEGEVTVLFEDFTEYAKYDGSTDVDVAVTITDGTHILVINQNKCRITSSPVNVSGRDRLQATYSWTSIYDTAATENVQVVLTNDEATIP